MATRAQLKTACDQQDWDLLDKLLEADTSHINDDALFTDTWGSWWGLVLETVICNQPDGLRVLLQRGAQPDLPMWGDGLPSTPLELAQDKPEILALLLDPASARYHRRTDPPLPADETPEEQAINRQGEIRATTGLVFPV